MRFNEFNEAIDKGHKAAIKGMHQLSGDQYYGMYKTMNDVAGHDGEKQTAPSGGTDDEVSDKPFAYAYTDEEEKMLKAVDPKAKRITSSKSEELDESQLDEFQFNPTGALASVIRWAVENPAIVAAMGVLAGGTAMALTSGTAALGPLMAAVTSINAGQGALGIITLKELKELIQNNPSQAEGYIKKLIYKYIGDQQDVREFEQIHAQTAYKGETEFRWRAEVWPVTLDKNAAESWLEKNDRYWLDTYRKEQAEKEQQAVAPTAPTTATQPTEALNRNYDANRTGFSRGARDDERHDLDTPRPLIYGLKINGKIWQKDGNVVTFFTKERALAARNAMLNKRPELEIGLVQRPQD